MTIDGANLQSGWSKWKNAVYVANDPVDLGEGNNQLFVDGTW